MYETQNRDIYSWNTYNWAAAVFGAVVTQFGALLIDSMANTFAQNAAGQSSIPSCKMVNGSYSYPNVTGCIKCSVGFGDQVYFSDDRYDYPPTLYIVKGLQPSAFALVVLAIRVFCEAICYISFGAMADYSNLRKNLLLLTAWCGAAVGLAFLGVPVDSQGSGLGPVVVVWIITSVFLGVSSVFHTAFIPFLAADHPAVKAEPEKAEQVKNHISGVGIVNGLLGTLLGFIIAIVMLTLAGALAEDATALDAQQGFRLAIFVTAVCWGIGTFGLLLLHPWPGKTLPEGTTSYVLHGWRQTAATLRRASQLPQMFRFLMLYFVYVSGIGTTASVGLLFAKHDMCATTLNQFIVVISVPISATVGVWVFQKVYEGFGLTTMAILRLTLAVYLFLPIWGIIGYIPTSPIGFRKIWELYFIGAWYGFILGSTGSYSRTVFSALIPPGEEAQFFSLFLATERASAWIGPLIIGMLTQTRTAGVMRVGLFYLLVTVAVPLLLLGYVDVEQGKEEALSGSSTKQIAVQAKYSTVLQEEKTCPQMTDAPSTATAATQEISEKSNPSSM